MDPLLLFILALTILHRSTSGTDESRNTSVAVSEKDHDSQTSFSSKSDVPTFVPTVVPRTEEASMNCAWVKAKDQSSTNLEAIYVASNCGYERSAQILQIIFIGKGVVWDPSKHIQSSSEYLGLDMSSSGSNATGWNYMRIFAADNEKICNHENLQVVHRSPNSKTFNQKCYVASSHKAWWVAPGVFQMNITLAAGLSYRLSLLQGLEGCIMPLESLNYSYGLTDACLEYNSSDPEYSKRTGPFPPCLTPICHVPSSHNILASFTVGKVVLPAASVPEAVSNCNYEDMPGVWTSSLWSPLQTCQAKSRGAASIGIIGDSHVVRMSRNHLYSMIPNANFVFEFQVLDNHETPLNHKICRPWGSCRTMERAFDNVMSKLSNKKGALVWFYGSHAQMYSQSEVRKHVRDGMSYIGSKQKDQCVILVGTPDPHHEDIPLDKYPQQQVYYRNSWRVKMQNDAMREAVQNSTNFHYFDLFEQTVALHFDNHPPGDPVHLSNPYYQVWLKQITVAVKDLCLQDVPQLAKANVKKPLTVSHQPPTVSQQHMKLHPRDPHSHNKQSKLNKAN